MLHRRKGQKRGSFARAITPISRGFGVPCFLSLRISSNRFETLGVIKDDQRIDDAIQIAVEDARQVREVLPDPVIGDSVLRVIIGSDLLGPLAGADLRQPRFPELTLALLLLARM